MISKYAVAHTSVECVVQFFFVWPNLNDSMLKYLTWCVHNCNKVSKQAGAELGQT